MTFEGDGFPEMKQQLCSSNESWVVKWLRSFYPTKLYNALTKETIVMGPPDVKSFAQGHTDDGSSFSLEHHHTLMETDSSDIKINTVWYHYLQKSS